MWSYMPVVNAGIQMLVTILLGVVFGRFKLFDADKFVPVAVQFVFYVALPCLVIRGIGIGVNFYSEKFLWTFILAFLVLRVIALASSVVIVVIGSHWSMKVELDKKKTVESSTRHSWGIGTIAVNWLAMTWISTVIFGVPILTAVFGSPLKGTYYGLLAGISSFILQLPLMLILLECHTLEREHITELEHQAQERRQHAAQEVEEVKDELAIGDEEKGLLPTQHDGIEVDRMSLWGKLLLRGDVWKKVGLRVIQNPVLWGIFWGFLLSLSTIGNRWLRPTSPEFVYGLAWFEATLGWLGDTVSPVSLFAMGLWMQAEGRKLFRIGPLKLFICMLVKLILVPLVMVGLAIGMGLNDEAGRAAVLIATLPISQASFSLAHQFGIGQALLSSNVTVGTLLMLPTVIVWNVILDQVGLFMIS